MGKAVNTDFIAMREVANTAIISSIICISFFYPDILAEDELVLHRFYREDAKARGIHKPVNQLPSR